jgi:lipoyl(octanoyl) transferase
LLLEHPPTFTLGRSGQWEHLLIDRETLADRGIALYEVDRGGDITYHGPGQLVGYPILDLRQYQLDYHAYLRQLEEVLIQTLVQFNQPAFREPGYTGVWVPSSDAGPIRSAKIAAIGVKVDATGITSHGFAININTDLSYFDLIVPCGIRHCLTTSLAAEQKRPIDMTDFKQRLASIFHDHFALYASDLTHHVADTTS